MELPASLLDESQRKAKLARQERKQVMSFLRWFRPLVHKAEAHAKKAANLEQKLRDYRSNTNGFRDKVAAHKNIFARQCLYAAVLAFYISGEVIVARMVASAIIPGLSDLAACIFYVLGFLVLSIVIKVWSSLSENAANLKLARLREGEESEKRNLLAKRWVWAVAKVCLLVAIGLSYVKVYETRVDMEEKKLVVMEALKADAEAISPQSLFEERPVSDALDNEAKSAARSTKARELAQGSLVMMGFLITMHALVLFIPITGFASDTSLRGFEPTRIAVKAEKIRDREEALLRRISYALKDSPEGHVREALIEAVQPVAKRIDALAKRDSGEDSGAAEVSSQLPPSGPPDSGDRSSVGEIPTNMAESSSNKAEPDLYEELFGVRG